MLERVAVIKILFDVRRRRDLIFNSQYLQGKFQILFFMLFAIRVCLISYVLDKLHIIVFVYRVGFVGLAGHICFESPGLDSAKLLPWNQLPCDKRHWKLSQLPLGAP